MKYNSTLYRMIQLNDEEEDKICKEKEYSDEEKVKNKET